MPSIGVYIICKNEENFIERCLSSVKDADSIVVCDTGSTDKTLEILEHSKSIYHQLIIKQIYVNPWRFDDAKNCALFSMPSDLDVCVSLDADETMEIGWYEILWSEIKKDIDTNGKVSDRFYHRFKTIWDWKQLGNNITEHWHERIHARHGYRWKLPVHEVLVKEYDSTEIIKWVKNLLMIQQPNTSKNRSYLTMLEQSVKEDKKIWKTFSFLASEYSAIGKYEEAIKSIETALQIDNSDKAFLYYQLSLVYSTSLDTDSAIENLRKACKSAPNIREYLVYLAKLYIKHNRKSDAISILEKAKNITERTFGYEYNPICWGYEFEKLSKEFYEA